MSTIGTRPWSCQATPAHTPVARPSHRRDRRPFCACAQCGGVLRKGRRGREWNGRTLDGSGMVLVPDMLGWLTPFLQYVAFASSLKVNNASWLISNEHTHARAIVNHLTGIKAFSLPPPPSPWSFFPLAFLLHKTPVPLSINYLYCLFSDLLSC